MTGAKSTGYPLVIVAVVALAMSVVVTTTPVAAFDGTDPAVQIQGEDGPARSIAVSQLTTTSEEVFQDDGPGAVLLGRDDVFADNLASGGAQGQDDGGRTLLLTSPDELDERVVDELGRLLPTGGEVIILGGTAGISDEVEQQVAALDGITVSRVSGPSRTETAIEVARRFLPDATTALLVRSDSSTDDQTQAFADSLAAGAWAAEAGFPILFTQSRTATPSTLDYLEDSAVETVIPIGGAAAISDEVLQAVADSGVTVAPRVAGASRVDTAAAVADERQLGASGAIVIDGQDPESWQEGFALASLAGRLGFPLLLAVGDTLPDVTRTAVEESVADDPLLVCGSLLTRRVCEELAELIASPVVTFPRPGTVNIPGTANIFGAGYGDTPEPGGGGGGTPPVEIILPDGISGQAITFANAGGGVDCCGGDPDTPIDGASLTPQQRTDVQTFRGISGLVGPVQLPLAGVFVGPGQPSEPAPDRQDFGGGVSEEDRFTPELQQTFFIGDGQNAEGPQAFVVPDGATHLFLGFVDALGFGGDPGHYDDNPGVVSIDVRLPVGG